MSLTGRYVRLASAHRAESLADELDTLAEAEAAALASLDSIVEQLRKVVNRGDAEAFGNQAAEALADAVHDERARLKEALRNCRV
jgi:hypothetical protein